MNTSDAAGTPVMTILEARVPSERWRELRQMYGVASTRQFPAQMLQTSLVQSVSEPTLWRALSVWRSREALEEYRKSVETPAGVLMFRAVGAEPTLSRFEVVASATARAGSD